MSDIQFFKSSDLKLDRAKTHVSELYRELCVLSQIRPETVATYFNPKTGQYLASAMLLEKPIDVDKLSGVIGDIVHNLRASLDVLACDLVRMKGGSVTGVYFPFAHDANDFEKMINHRKIDRAGKDVVDMVRALEPYPGGNESLWALHVMDIMDKHASIIPVVSSHMWASGPMKDGVYLVGKNRQKKVPLEDSLKAYDASFKHDIHITEGARFSIYISFQDVPVFGDTDVLTTLVHLVKMVEDILNMFRSTIKT